VLANRRAYDDAKGKGGYVVVYYRGSNDAWDGYGGAVIYTREPKLRQEYVPEISAALDKVCSRGGQAYVPYLQSTEPSVGVVGGVV